MYGSGRCSPQVMAAAERLENRLERNKTIQSIEVRKRPVERTLEERYAIYREGCAELQASVLKEAADHPECTLRNTYTHVMTVPFSCVDHAFLDTLDIPRYK